MEITEDTGKHNIHGLVETTAGEEKAQERIQYEEMETANMHSSRFLERRRGKWFHEFTKGILFLEANQCIMF